MAAASKASKQPDIEIRPLEERDIKSLYEIYSTQEKLIPHQPKTRFKQFANQTGENRFVFLLDFIRIFIKIKANLRMERNQCLRYRSSSFKSHLY